MLVSRYVLDHKVITTLYGFVDGLPTDLIVAHDVWLNPSCSGDAAYHVRITGDVYVLFR